jgi:hypothetical protein
LHHIALGYPVLTVRLIRTILDALQFVKSKSYVNTARVDPALLRVVSGRLRVVDTNAIALCLMVGTVTESFLIKPCIPGRYSTSPVHKITIAPFEQEFRRDTSLWGLLFDFHVISGTISTEGFGFASRREGKGDGFGACECDTCLIIPGLFVRNSLHSCVSR